MKTKEDKVQNNRKVDEKRNPDSENNSATQEKEWDPKNDPDEDWGTKEDENDDDEKKKDKDPDEKVEY
ncbi:MAG: hypothetical protein ACSHXF_11550 [Aquaticitalea sp.]